MKFFPILCISIAIISAGTVEAGPLPGQQGEATAGTLSSENDIGQKSLKQPELVASLTGKPSVSVTAPKVVILNLGTKQANSTVAVGTGTGTHTEIRPGYVLVIGSQNGGSDTKQEGLMYDPPKPSHPSKPPSENDPSVPVVIIVGPQVQFGVPNGVINGPQIQIADEVAVINGAQTQVGGENPVINGAQTQVNGEDTVINGAQNGGGDGNGNEAAVVDPANDPANLIVEGSNIDFKGVRVVIVKS